MGKKKKKMIPLTPEQQIEADYQKAIRRLEGASKMLQSEDRFHMYKEALKMFGDLGDYRDSREYYKKCKKSIPIAREEFREDVYQSGLQLKADARTTEDYDTAIQEFQRLKTVYRDIPEQIRECQQLKEKTLKAEQGRIICKKVVSLAIAAAAVALILFLRTPTAFYLEGKFLMGLGDYERANTIFAKSIDHKDTPKLVSECNYQRAMKFAEEGHYVKAVRLLQDKVGDHKDALEKKAMFEQKILSGASIGDTVLYGDSRWIVADIRDKKYLLIAKKTIPENIPFASADGTVSWASSAIRTWLNEDYYTACFSSYEQEAVLQSEVTTAANSVYGTDGGPSTQDRVFIPDEAEAARYSDLLELSEDKTEWWLRTPGKTPDSAMFISSQGAPMPYGYAADSTEIAIRPAVWIQSS